MVYGLKSFPSGNGFYRDGQNEGQDKHQVGVPQ